MRHIARNHFFLAARRMVDRCGKAEMALGWSCRKWVPFLTERSSSAAAAGLLAGTPCCHNAGQVRPPKGDAKKQGVTNPCGFHKRGR